jgi:hypothetical protein
VNFDGYALPIKKLKGTEPVESLDLSGKKLGVASTIVIASLISGNSGLTSIDLSGNQLCGVWTQYGQQHGTYTAEGIAAIAEALRVNGGLTSLNLSDNQLCGLDQYGDGNYTAEGITAIADALRVNGVLTMLSLAKNKLEADGTKAICEALEQNKTLKELDISGNWIGDSNIGGSAGVKHVAKMLSFNGGLTSIDVRQNNNVGDGAVQLAAAVLGNLKIEIFNKIPIKEMRANSLTELDLNGKYVGVEGGMVVAGLIPVMGALTQVR